MEIGPDGQLVAPQPGAAIVGMQPLQPPATVPAAPVFFSRTNCPHCHAMHEWFAQDAWVCDSASLDCDPICEQPVA